MHQHLRARLDQLFAIDAAASVLFGILALLAPHGVLTKLSGGSYNHSVHEALRCVRFGSTEGNCAVGRSPFFIFISSYYAFHLPLTFFLLLKLVLRAQIL